MIANRILNSLQGSSSSPSTTMTTTITATVPSSSSAAGSALKNQDNNGNTIQQEVRPPLPKTYTLKEVSKHTTSDDLWMIIHGKVYNVTQFIPNHPGGAEVLFDCAGIDATLPFEDVGHSEDAVEMLKECCLGDLIQKDRDFLKNLNKIDITNPTNTSSSRRQQQQQQSFRPSLSSESSSSDSSSYSAISKSISPSLSPTTSRSSSTSPASDQPLIQAPEIIRKKKKKTRSKNSKQQQAIGSLLALHPDHTIASSATAATATVHSGIGYSSSSTTLINSSSLPPAQQPIFSSSSFINRKTVSDRIMEIFSTPVLFCISLSALVVYIYLQTLKSDYL